MSEVLKTFFIDTVLAVSEDPDSVAISSVGGFGKPQVQMVRHSVLGRNAQEAINRFVNEDAGVVVEEAEMTDMVIVGVSAGSGTIDITGDEIASSS